MLLFFVMLDTRYLKTSLLSTGWFQERIQA